MKKRAFVRYSKQGKVVPGSLILTAGSFPQGSSTWKEVPADLCCETIQNSFKTLDFNLLNFKNNLGTELWSCHVGIRSTITGVNLFYDEFDGSPNRIGDGGEDMYDEGNALNTNLTQLYANIKEDNINNSLNIPYTHTQATSYNDDYLYATPPMDGGISNGDSYFGTGSNYFTNMYPGLFILAANNITGITEFSITGNLGSDGNGTNFFYKQPTSYIGWTGYYKTNNDNTPWGDPSVNHIILVKGSSNAVTQVGDTTGEYDDHAVQNLTNDNTDIIVVVFSTVPGTPKVTKEQFRTIADAILDVAAGTSVCND